MPRHFVDLFTLDPQLANRLIDRALVLKRRPPGERPLLLQGRCLGLLFEKPSMRTRVSFEAAITRLGGSAIFLRGDDVGLGVRESVVDFARVISQYVDALAVRTYSHKTVEDLAGAASVPVINALSDAAHPCQAMADLMTIKELRGSLEGKRVAFVGDGNNVARSLAAGSALLGARFVLTCPKGYAFPEEFQARYAAAFPASPLTLEHDPRAAVAGADVVYTDVWASMGQEHEAESRRSDFAPFQVNEDLLGLAAEGAIFLHCLPARRGEEVVSAVLDGPQSKVILQAANRLHFQVALLEWLLAGETSLGDRS